MRTGVGVATLVVLLGVAALLACEAPRPDGAAVEVLVAEVDTLVRAEEEVLARPTEIVTDERGLLYVLDAGDATIRVLDSSGPGIRAVGREGSGPGELRSPRSLRVTRDTIRVLDAGNGRVQVFATDGTFLRTGPMPGPATSGAVAFSADGKAIVALNGTDSSLAQRFSPSAKPGARLGVPVAPPSAVWDFVAIKEEIRQGSVPAVLRNIVLPALADDGSAWVLLQAEGRVQYYSQTDSLLWDTRITEPEFAEIREEFFERNRADDLPFRFTQLSYFVQATVVQNDLWVLVRNPDHQPALILVVDTNGAVRKRIRFVEARGIRGFAIDQSRSVIYLLAYQDAALLRARLPRGAL